MEQKQLLTLPGGSRRYSCCEEGPYLRWPLVIIIIIIIIIIINIIIIITIMRFFDTHAEYYSN